MQVYQQSFSDAFAALLDLFPGKTHSMVYLYCLEEAVNADGQLADILMPAHHVKMDSSVPWDIVRVHTFTSASTDMSNVPFSPLQGPQDQKLRGYSSLETGLRCDKSAFTGIKTNMEAQQQQRVADFFLQDDFMTSSIRHLMSPEDDPFSLSDDDDDDDGDEEHHNRFEGELLGLDKRALAP
jgi:hypothetical protein